MHINSQKKLAFRHSGPRWGVAPIEFVMFMPVLLVFVLVTLWIARVQNAATRASLDAEASAMETAVLLIEQGNLAGSMSLPGPQATELDQLVRAFDSSIEIAGGVVEGHGVRATGDGVGTIIRPLGAVNDYQQTMAHTWESDVFSFPQLPSAQLPLTMPVAMRGIAPDLQDLNRFTALLNFTGETAGATWGTVGSTLSKLVKSTGAIEAGISQLTSEIARLAVRIRWLENQLEPDRSAIARLREELTGKQRQRDRLLLARQHAR